MAILNMQIGLRCYSYYFIVIIIINFIINLLLLVFKFLKKILYFILF